MANNPGAGFYAVGEPTLLGAQMTGAERFPLDTGAAFGTTVAAVTASGLRALAQPHVMFRNLLQGGNFSTNPWQRGTTISAISATTLYTADRWFVVAGTSSAVVASQVALSGSTALSGFGHAFNLARPNSNAVVLPIYVGQIVESANVTPLQGRAVTLSFWARALAAFSSVGAALNVGICTGTGTDQGIGGSPTALTGMIGGAWTGQRWLTSPQGVQVVPVSTPNTFVTPDTGVVNSALATQAATLTSAWQRFTVTVSVPTTATELGIFFNYTPVGTTTGTTDGFQLAGVQLEASSQPSNFEFRSAQLELMLCQRYYVRINEPASGFVVSMGMISTTNNETVVIPLPVTMRAAPTVTVSAGSFTFNIAGTQTAVGGGFAGSANQTPANAVVVGTVTATVGQATQLVGGGGAGYVQASADL